MGNYKDKIVTIVLGLIAIGIIVCTLGRFLYAYMSILIDIGKRESKENYRYVYAVPETPLFLHTYFYNDSLCTFIGNDTIAENCSHFSVRYFPGTTLVLLDVVNDSLVYLVDYNNDSDTIYNKGVKVERILHGFYNSKYYDKRYREGKYLYYVPKFPLIARIGICAGKVDVNDAVVKPIMIKRETMVIPLTQ